MSREATFARPAAIALRRIDTERALPRADPLPRPLTSLIGREADLAAIVALVDSGQVRLLTVTGPGGIGKTRLVLRLAEATAAFGDAVAFVPLAAITDPDLVLPTVARTLGLRETGQRPILQALTAHLHTRRVLLILDNVEQVAEAAPRIADVLAACPGLSVVVTSRVVLRLSGEHVFAMSPLALPAREPAALSDGADHPPPHPEEAAAIQLFVERARAVQHDFALTAANRSAVVEICQTLDGLPLAIELAAARLRVLTPAALLARLETRLDLLTSGPQDAPDRLRTMRNAIGWSYDLLPEREQAFFRRLAAFAGGFSLEAAEAVAGEPSDGSPSASRLPPPATSVLELLSALLDHSLLRRVEQGDQRDQEPRFDMLETVREYGSERLAASDEQTAIRQRHAEYFATLADAGLVAFWSSRPGEEQMLWLDRLERDHDNLRAALTWAIHHDAATAVRLVGALSHFWWQQGFLREGIDWTTRTAALREAAPTPLRARALHAASLMVGEQGDHDRSVALAEEALALYRTLDDRAGIRRSVQILGIAVMQTGDLERAATLFAELLARAREMGHVRGISTALAHLGSVAIKRGEFDRARPFLMEAAALGRQANDRFALAWFLFKLGELERAQGNSLAAMAHVRESLTLYQTLGSPERAGDCLLTLAALAESTSDPEWVVRLLGAAEELGHAESGGVLDVDLVEQERLRDRLRTLLGDDAFAAAWEAGRELSLADAVAAALTTPPASGAIATVGELPPGIAADLTPRQHEVLRLLAEGRSDKEIAAALCVTRRTASNHVAAILARLGVESRTAAVILALHGQPGQR